MSTADSFTLTFNFNADTADGAPGGLAACGVLLEQLGQRYRDAGVADVTVQLYPAARHEILNETNREEVTGDVVAWLRARVEVV